MFGAERYFGDCLNNIFTSGDKESKNWCINNGLREFNSSIPNVKLFRECNTGAYGIADFVSVEEGFGTVSVKILEIKNTSLTFQDVGQLCRYITGFKRMLRNNSKVQVDVKGILIGESISSNNDFTYLLNELLKSEEESIISIGEYKLNPVKGLSIEYTSDGWTKTNEEGLEDAFESIFIGSDFLKSPSLKKGQKRG